MAEFLLAVSTLDAAVSAVAAFVTVRLTVEAQREARADAQVRKYEELIELLRRIQMEASGPTRSALSRFVGASASLPATRFPFVAKARQQHSDVAVLNEATEELQLAIDQIVLEPKARH